MYGLLECISTGCVAQKGDHAKISCQVIQGWDRTLAGHLNSAKYLHTPDVLVINKNLIPSTFIQTCLIASEKVACSSF